MLPIDFKALAAPFQMHELEWRIGSAGVSGRGRAWAKILCYLTNRAVQDRLDAVCGAERWWNEYQPGPAKGVVCGITIRTDAGPVTKWDGAENTDIESVKGGLSDSMKRAAVQWGIGRYLYSLGETWADCSTTERDGWEKARTKDGDIWWKTPDNVGHLLADAYSNANRPKPAAAPADEPGAKQIGPPPEAPKKPSHEGFKVATAVNKVALELKLSLAAQDILTAAKAPLADGRTGIWTSSEFLLVTNSDDAAHVEAVIDALRNYLRAERSRTAA